MSGVDAPLRVTIRQEGAWIHAHLRVFGEPMENGIHVASLLARSAEHPGVFEQFKAMAGAIGAAVVEEVVGPGAVAYTREEEPPEHEKVGHA